MEPISAMLRYVKVRPKKVTIYPQKRPAVPPLPSVKTRVLQVEKLY
jgi:hypothetical protein